jgi:antibiotic biosynthesis monooxygenase (ABM) superfamily enzyme
MCYSQWFMAQVDCLKLYSHEFTINTINLKLSVMLVQCIRIVHLFNILYYIIPSVKCIKKIWGKKNNQKKQPKKRTKTFSIRIVECVECQ